MSYSGSFTKNSTTGAQTITGVGFQPSAIIFFASGVTGAGAWAGGIKEMVGIWSPFGGGYAVCAAIKDGAATTQSARRFAANPLTFCTTTNALESEASLVANADGFTLTWTTNTASTGYVVNFIAFTSTEAPQSQILNWTMPTSGGATVTGLAWQPNLVFHLHAGGVTTLGGATSAALGFGVMGPNATDNAGATETGQWGTALFDVSASGTSAAFSKFSSPSGASASKGCMFGLTGIGADSLRGTFKSFDAGGFSLNFPTNPSGAFQVASLCLQVSAAFVGSFTKSTAAAPVTQTVASGLSFNPGTAFYATTSKTSAGGTGGLRVSLNACASGASPISTAIQDKNGVSPSVASSYLSDNLDIANNDTQTITSVGVPQFPGSGAMSVNWTTNDANGTVVGFVAMKAATVPPVTTSAWVVINEPIGGLTDQTSRVDLNDDGSFQLQMRNRGTGSVTLRIAPTDSYAPTLGTQIFLYDVGPTSSHLNFAGTIDVIEQIWEGPAGYRKYRCSLVSLEQCLDVIQVPPQAFINTAAGTIVTTLFNALMTGSPITLGTISAGLTIASLVLSDYPSLWSVINDLATQCQFVTFVDPATQTLQFHTPSLTTAPITLASTDMLWDSYTWQQNRQDFRDQQVIQISQNAFSNASELFQGNSSAQTFTLRELPNQVVNAWVTKNTQNTATGTFTGVPVPGETVTISYPAGGSTYNWAALAPYTTGQIIIDPAGHVQKVTTGGTSGAVQPTWNDAGSTTVDGSVIWTDQGISGGGSFADTIYTFVATLDNTAWGQVLIGATAAACATNLVYALNAKESQRGITYSKPTWENPLLNADAPAGGVFTVRNKSAGQGYIAALAESATNFSWSALLTSGGSTTAGTVTLQVAVEGTSNTANLYYTPGTASVKLASVPSGPGLPISSSWYLQVEYTRLGGDCIVVENSTLVASRAATEHGTGKYQQKMSQTSWTSAPQGLSAVQNALIAYETLPVTFSFDTYDPGLLPGQYLTINVSNRPVGIAPLVNNQYLIQSVDGKIIPVKTYLSSAGMPAAANAGHYRYTVKVINTSVVQSYLEWWGQQGGSGGGGGSSSGIVVAGASPAGASTATVTSVALTAPAQFAVTGSPVTTAGTLAIAWNTQNRNTVLAGPATGAPAAPTFRALVAADIGFAFVTSVGITLSGLSSLFSVSGSPVTSAGSITLTQSNSFANTIYAGPASGPSSGATFRALVAADIPNISATYLTVANNLSDVSNPGAARANLGLDSMAQQAVGGSQTFDPATVTTIVFTNGVFQYAS